MFERGLSCSSCCCCFCGSFCQYLACVSCVFSKASFYIIRIHTFRTEQDVLIAKLGQPEMILDLALTQFGCYVARALLRDERVNATLAMQLILENQSNLDATPHGQRFLVDVGVIQPYPVGSMSGT